MWRSHYFTSHAAGTDPPDLVHITYRSFIESDSFSCSCIDAVCVVAVFCIGKDYIERHWFGRYSILAFIRLLLPLMLPVLTELFNFTSSTLFGKFLALFLFPKFIPLQRSLTNALFLFYLSLQRLLKMLCTSRWYTTSAAMIYSGISVWF
jgi:hypothetical protein